MKKQKRKIRTDRVMIILLCVFMFSIGLVTLLKSDLFNLTKVEIVGNSVLKKDEVINEEKLITKKNIFSYKLKDIKKEIQSNPYVDDVEVKRKLPNKIVITIKEKEVIALLSNGTDFCYIDNSGNLIEKIDNLDENNDKIVFNVKYTLNNGTVKFENDKVKKSVLNLIALLKEEHLENEISEIEYTGSNVNIIVNIGPKFLIINDDNLDYNISRTSKILVDLQSKNIKSGIVDLTYSNYAVYKPS
ncbi:cell division protein FtsQ/DivIB [Romboutsia sp. Marseille-P6047]|uniref:cell division protein FtsQ/DivIB n=1 Tax=Romboutsia sp. Marseille-P6047 TaxID=2161817 RepID=UPI0013DDE200|nr:FtsQ-type POTRA domain-containing protein [Romboutsia sp. Marseille-P6047]